jgi:hypothetical protein
MVKMPGLAMSSRKRAAEDDFITILDAELWRSLRSDGSNWKHDTELHTTLSKSNLCIPSYLKIGARHQMDFSEF